MAGWELRAGVRQSTTLVVFCIVTSHCHAPSLNPASAPKGDNKDGLLVQRVSSDNKNSPSIAPGSLQFYLTAR